MVMKSAFNKLLSFQRLMACATKVVLKVSKNFEQNRAKIFFSRFQLIFDQIFKEF